MQTAVHHGSSHHCNYTLVGTRRWTLRTRLRIGDCEQGPLASASRMGATLRKGVVVRTNVSGQTVVAIMAIAESLVVSLVAIRWRQKHETDRWLREQRTAAAMKHNPSQAPNDHCRRTPSLPVVGEDKCPGRFSNPPENDHSRSRSRQPESESCGSLADPFDRLRRWLSHRHLADHQLSRVRLVDVFDLAPDHQVAIRCDATRHV